MTLTLPDSPTTERMSEDELRLELACALYAQGKIGKVGGADLAGVDFFTFQGALGDRKISGYTVEMIEEDLANLKTLRRK